MVMAGKSYPVQRHVPTTANNGSAPPPDSLHETARTQVSRAYVAAPIPPEPAIRCAQPRSGREITSSERETLTRGWGVKTWPCLKPLGAQKIHPVTIYLTNNFHMHIPCCNIAHLGYTQSYCCFTVKRNENSKSVASRTHRCWCRDRGPVINIVGVPHAPSLVPSSRACHKHCGLGNRLGSNPVINGVARQ